MTRWEVECAERSGDKFCRVERLLREGWEPFAVTVRETRGGQYHCYHLRRQVEVEAE